MTTLRDVLKNTTSTLHQHITYSLDEAKLEARFILEYVLKINQKEMIQENDQFLDREDQEKIQSIIDKRISGIPLPYLLGEWSFYGRIFKVNRNVLIPRADTEILIEKALSKINKHDTFHILDLGCGTGIIGITLALERPFSKVTLIDKSEYALKNTKDNIALHHACNTSIHKSNWYSALNKKKFDIIISNPPYLRKNDPHLLQGLEHEPTQALVSGPVGLEAIKIIIQKARNHLLPSGWLFIEHGYNQSKDLINLFTDNQFKKIDQHNDIHEITRITFGQIKYEKYFTNS